MKVGSIVKVPRKNFTCDDKDTEILTIKVTLIKGEHTEGIVIKNAPQKWGNSRHCEFCGFEVITEAKEEKERVDFT